MIMGLKYRLFEVSIFPWPEVKGYFLGLSTTQSGLLFAYILIFKHLTALPVG